MAVLFWIVVVAILAVAGWLGWNAMVTRRLAADAERRIPPVGKTVMVGGDSIHYVDQGAGRPILFVHGLGGQLHHFRQALFPAMDDGFRLVAMDRPGSGYSTRISSGARIPEQAAAIARFIDAVGLDRPLLVGHSLGGAIALRVALDHPDKIAGLALISPLTHYVPTPPKEFGGLYIRSPLMRRIIAATLAVPASLKNASQTLDFVFGPQPVPADYAIGGGGYLGLRPSHFHATSSDLVAVEQDLPGQMERYGEIRIPVGILFGSRDRVLHHTRHGLAMEGLIEGIDLEILEGVGHMPQFVEAEKVASFVKRVAGRAFAA
ncbi:alpha/beta fold hydrolase [Aquibium carbonis]|uniref:Alpha/beta fold hydrolase n=1 Tax=Aquibium carbonis TaxID=2495581 RepID=A0A429Z285_9HYPH|nr:alpha/beta fold hydrolase [Aquibium carbonis]RST87825.1 alpha/beta fold hydrolase [Aquibium carbonis]